MTLAPGDLLLTRSKTGVAGRVIRLGACIRDLPGLHNHVAVYTHDTDGVPWGLEGKPGGVGWVDLRRYLADPWTVNNAGQPKAEGQRATIVAAVRAMLGAQYDWSAIAADAAMAIGMPDLLKSGPVIPGHVVCSSLAAWAYRQAELDAPAPPPEWRTVTPAAWEVLIIEKGWSR
jgi:hypothetical protein